MSEVGAPHKKSSFGVRKRDFKQGGRLVGNILSRGATKQRDKKKHKGEEKGKKEGGIGEQNNYELQPVLAASERPRKKYSLGVVKQSSENYP